MAHRQEIETFSGAALPAPWGANASSTGIVRTDIDAERTLVTDQAGKQRISKTNALGQLKEIWETLPTSQTGSESVAFPGTAIAHGFKTTYNYDTLNNLTTVNQGVQERTFTYNSLSRLLSATNPESGTISYEYDNNGNLSEKIDARNIVTNYTYDDLNRLTNREYSDTTPDVEYTYKTTAPGLGSLIKVESSVSTTEYTGFDILGRVIGHKQTTDGLEYSTGYVYNLSGAMVEQTYPSGRVVKNVIDNNGDLSIVQSRKNASHGYWNYANSFTYNAAGAVTSMQLGNGRWESTQFNSRLQPTQIALGATNGATNLLKLDYEYGALNLGTGETIAGTNNGNVSKQIITVANVGVNPGFVATQYYAYDSLNRLQIATENVTPEGQSTQLSWRQQFTYDRYGNRNFDEANTTTLPKECTESGNPVVCEAIRPVVNPSVNTANNRLNGYTFDQSGNTTEDAQDRKFTYDAENKQVMVETLDSNGDPIATIGEYFYDGDGRRIKKIVPSTGEVTIFVYSANGQLVAEYSTQISQDPKVSYSTSDHLGSPRILTDENGQVISRRDFHPFGEEIATVERTQELSYTSDDVRQKFTTYERDGETDLDFAQARYYNSSLGRFSCPDDFLNDTHVSDPSSWNLYVYVRNNPLTLSDPSGEKIYAGNITDTKDRDEFLRRANYTYGCSSCVTIDGDGYVQVDTTGLSQEVISATAYLTTAINSTDPSQLFDVQVTNNSSDVAFGDAQRNMGNVSIKNPDGTLQKVESIRIRLDFADDAQVIGGSEADKASFLNLIFAHEVSHFAPSYKRDPTTPGERGGVDNPVNEIRLARGLPLRAEYHARDFRVGGLVYLKFGNAVKDSSGNVTRGSDGINVTNEAGKIIFWNQKKVKK